MRFSPSPSLTRSGLGPALEALAGCRGGALSVTFAITLLAVLALLLVAVDVGRLQLAETRLQIALDAAALAGTRDIHSATLQADVRQVFDANFEPDDTGATLTDFQMLPVNDGFGVRRLQLSAQARLDSPLGRLLDIASLEWHLVEAENETRRATRGVELVMVLDNTGSMRGSRMSALRTAAQSLADALFDQRETVPHLWVGVVPYSATVNVGSTYTDWLADPASDPALPPTAMTDFAPTTWKGCVLARTDGRDLTDTPPADAPFDAFFWPSMTEPPATYNGYDSGTPLNIWPDDGGAVDERNQAQNQGYGPNLGCGPAILALTPRYSEVTAKIGEMEAWHRGGTMANMGLVWGWRALSPQWRGLWRDTSGSLIEDQPLDYDTPYMNKVIVLMTDGNNEWFKEDYTAYRYPSAGLLAGTTVNARMLETCTRLKNAGIVVFAVTFGSGVTEATQELYSNCASAPDQNVNFVGPKYFHAPTDAELQTAFDTIGGRLTELRLTQ